MRRLVLGAAASVVIGLLACNGYARAEFTVRSSPDKAHVFQKIRGESVYRGLTPLRMGEGDIGGKTKLEFLLYKPGYKIAEFTEVLSSGSVETDLEEVSSIIDFQSEPSRRCRQLIGRSARETVVRAQALRHSLQLPLVFLETPLGARVTFEVLVLDGATLEQLSKRRRRDRAGVDEFILSETQPLLAEFAKSLAGKGCAAELSLTVKAPKKRMQLQVRPHREYYSYVIEGPYRSTIVWGYETSLKSDFRTVSGADVYRFQIPLD